MSWKANVRRSAYRFVRTAAVQLRHGILKISALRAASATPASATAFGCSPSPANTSGITATPTNPQRFRLGMELLEARTVPATVTQWDFNSPEIDYDTGTGTID